MSYNPNQPTDNTPFGQPSSQHGAATGQQPYGSTPPAGQSASPQYGGSTAPFGAPQHQFPPNYNANPAQQLPGFPSAPAPLPQKSGISLKTALYPAILAAVAGLAWIIVYFAMYKKNFNSGDISATKSAITVLTIAEILFYLGLIGAAVLAALPIINKGKKTSIQPQNNYGQQANYGTAPGTQQPYGQVEQPYWQQTQYQSQPATQYGMPMQYPTATPAPSHQSPASQYGDTASAAISQPASQPSSQYGGGEAAPSTPEAPATTSQYETSAIEDTVETSSTAVEDAVETGSAAIEDEVKTSAIEDAVETGSAAIEQPLPNPQTPWGQAPQGTNPWTQQQPPQS